MTLDLETKNKIRDDHLRRDAFLYIRQSSLQQVFNNTESTQRQYALRQRAVALGWPNERVHVIDCDQGQSGASAKDRMGFQQLVTEVGMGHAGIVLGLEVSRLARNSSDWHRLLEICALSDTLILDEDGLYDPSHFNDRLLLGLKGTMSEAELHVLRARLQGGIKNKARRGELQIPLPVGLTYDDLGRVTLEPDSQVQNAIRLFFQVFQRTGTACAVVQHFRKNKIDFPRCLRRRERAGRLVWGPLQHSRALQVLHNPRYAGAFVFGRTRTRRLPSGRTGLRVQPQDAWQVLLPDVHPGYITWSQYQDHQRMLRANGAAYGADRRRSPPHQGPALLQGLVVCGACGRRMTVRYHHRFGTVVGDYVCQHEYIEHGGKYCQAIPGRNIDKAISDIILEMLTPDTIELACSVQREIQARQAEVAQVRQQQVERARYESDLARDRFMRVDPNNRLVADSLEADWNEKLRTLNDAQETAEHQRKQDVAVLDEETHRGVMQLVRDLPALWKNTRVTDQDRKRMIRLLIEDVTLTRGAELRLQIRFKAGATKTMTLPLPMNAWQLRETSPEVVALIDRLLDDFTYTGIATELNKMGHKSGMKQEFTANIIGKICRHGQLVSREERLLRRGLLTLGEISRQLGVHQVTIIAWRKIGLVVGYPYNDRDDYLYEKPAGDHIPQKRMGHKLSDRAQATNVLLHTSDEVHHAT